MLRECTIQLSPALMERDDAVLKAASRQLQIAQNRIRGVKILRRSIDSRKGKPKFVLRLLLAVDQDLPLPELPVFPFQDVSNAPSAIIVGMGPAGLFAALELIRQGIKPIILDRGKAVRERRRDLAKLNREGVVNPDSNYCFGEGGAGTFSDGKLYTRSTKRGNVKEVLEHLVRFGAKEDIRIDAHPHIGTNKLPGIITNIREKILECGGEICFETRLSGLDIVSGALQGIEINGKEYWKTRQLILATGHSARDVFELLHQKGLDIEAKPFALGVRVEHPQTLIDQIQYRCEGNRHPQLPAASYSLVRQVQGKGVYSFCMCPGGIICPASTAEGELVVNGWSPSKRDGKFANSGMVVEVGLEDLKDRHPLAGVQFQQIYERKAFEAGGGKQVAPAQRMTDFLQGRISGNLPSCSYLPGVQSTNLAEILPTFVTNRLQGAFRSFGNKMKGYLSSEALVIGIESRTSSPIRVPREKSSLMHPQAKGLFPCGEGAGYAGGIMSAALDGLRCAEALSAFVKHN